MAAAGWREAQDARPPARRKSDRLSGTENKVSTVPVKRSIVLKKIEPQKNMPKPVPGQSLQDPRLATCITTAPRRSPRISPKAMKENVCEGPVRPESAPSSDTAYLPVTSSTLETGTWPDMAPALLGDRGSVMSLKVRRSYSRVSPFGIYASSDGAASRSLGSTPSDGSDTSTPNQSLLVRRSFFGFERLLANEALSGVSPVRPLTPKRKGTELPARDIPTAATLVPHDANIPGVTIAKKRKKRKIVPIEKLALDEWAAQMNASFEEAERFDLLVE